jgi:hypothetical protein
LDWEKRVNEGSAGDAECPEELEMVDFDKQLGFARSGLYKYWCSERSNFCEAGKAQYVLINGPKNKLNPVVFTDGEKNDKSPFYEHQLKEFISRSSNIDLAALVKVREYKSTTEITYYAFLTSCSMLCVKLSHRGPSI